MRAKAFGTQTTFHKPEHVAWLWFVACGVGCELVERARSNLEQEQQTTTKGDKYGCIHINQIWLPKRLDVQCWFSIEFDYESKQTLVLKRLDGKPGFLIRFIYKSSKSGFGGVWMEK